MQPEEQDDLIYTQDEFKRTADTNLKSENTDENMIETPDFIYEMSKKPSAERINCRSRPVSRRDQFKYELHSRREHPQILITPAPRHTTNNNGNTSFNEQKSSSFDIDPDELFDNFDQHYRVRYITEESNPRQKIDLENPPDVRRILYKSFDEPSISYVSRTIDVHETRLSTNFTQASDFAQHIVRKSITSQKENEKVSYLKPLQYPTISSKLDYPVLDSGRTADEDLRGYRDTYKRNERLPSLNNRPSVNNPGQNGEHYHNRNFETDYNQDNVMRYKIQHEKISSARNIEPIQMNYDLPVRHLHQNIDKANHQRKYPILPLKDITNNFNSMISNPSYLPELESLESRRHSRNYAEILVDYNIANKSRKIINTYHDNNSNLNYGGIRHKPRNELLHKMYLDNLNPPESSGRFSHVDRNYDHRIIKDSLNFNKNLPIHPPKNTKDGYYGGRLRENEDMSLVSGQRYDHRKNNLYPTSQQLQVNKNSQYSYVQKKPIHYIINPGRSVSVPRK